MLPEEHHNEACKLLCIWLRRLEERDRRNGSHSQNATPTNTADLRCDLDTTTTARQTMPDLPASVNTRAKGKRQRGNAKR
jgi:hypothetical protein